MCACGVCARVGCVVFVGVGGDGGGGGGGDGGGEWEGVLKGTWKGLGGDLEGDLLSSLGQVRSRSGLVQVWFSLHLKFNSFEFDSEVGRLV